MSPPSTIAAALIELDAKLESSSSKDGKGRIFVTGVFGSGKSYLARRMARAFGLPMVSFDRGFDYDSPRNQSRTFLGALPSSCVVDAIPIDEQGTWADFLTFEADTAPIIICVYCPDQGQWVRRIISREVQLTLGRSLPGQLWRRLRRHFSYAVRSFRDAASNSLTLRDEMEQVSLKAYRRFYTENVEFLTRFKKVYYFDSSRNEWTSREEMLHRMKAVSFPLQDRIWEMRSVYDVAYQDIEVLASSGYSNSHKTWERISGLLNWQGQRITDLGCFHGYFSFKAEDAGGQVLGLDRSPEVLETARMINAARGGNVVFRQWIGGEPTPSTDVVLCLNVLHHFGDDAAQGNVLASLNCGTVLLEVNCDRIPLVESIFGQVSLHPSHRKDRVILVANSKKA